MPNLRETQADVSVVMADAADPLRFTEASVAVLLLPTPPLRVTEETAHVVIAPHPPLRFTELTVNLIMPNTGVRVPWHLFFNIDLGAF